MIDEPATEFEYSAYCTEIERENVKIEVLIYRRLDNEEPWTLEVINATGGSTMWDERYTSDAEAFAVFEKTLLTEGIQTFLSGRH